MFWHCLDIFCYPSFCLSNYMPLQRTQIHCEENTPVQIKFNDRTTLCDGIGLSHKSCGFCYEDTWTKQILLSWNTSDTIINPFQKGDVSMQLNILNRVGNPELLVCRTAWFEKCWCETRLANLNIWYLKPGCLSVCYYYLCWKCQPFILVLWTCFDNLISSVNTGNVSRSDN